MVNCNYLHRHFKIYNLTTQESLKAKGLKNENSVTINVISGIFL